MKTGFQCPCGDELEGADEDELVEVVRAHLAEKHPDRDYSREQILLFADEL
jgi:hypothetical protein